MNTYYTKEQMDFLAEEIGKRIKQTSSQEAIKLKYESNEDTNVLTDSEKELLASIPTTLRDIELALNQILGGNAE